MPTAANRAPHRPQDPQDGADDQQDDPKRDQDPEEQRVPPIAVDQRDRAETRQDQVEERVEAEMKVLEGQAKEQVADGLQDEKLRKEGRRLKAEGERELKEAAAENKND